MKIGIGLPTAIRGTRGDVLIDWARRAEARGFSSLGTIGRVAYPSYSELITLAAAAAATERIGLKTDILLGPIYNPVLLAKDLASLDQISGGRFVLGASVGARKDDFDVTHQDLSTRGRRWDEALELMHQIWRGDLDLGWPVRPWRFGRRPQGRLRRHPPGFVHPRSPLGRGPRADAPDLARRTRSRVAGSSLALRSAPARTTSTSPTRICPPAVAAGTRPSS